MHAGVFTFRPPRRVSKGFSLIEVIVVMGIFAVLIALILPAVQNARIVVNRTQCAANLRQIGLAYVAFVDKHNMNAGSFKAKPNWPSQLRQYLSNRDDIFICIDDDQVAAVAAADPGRSPLPKAWILVRASSVPPDQLARGAVPGGGVGQKFRLSYENANPKQGVKQVPPPEGQPNTPGIIYLTLETGYFSDWDDLTMRLDPVPADQGGGYILTPLSETTSPFTFDFVGPNDDILASDFKPGSPPLNLPSNPISYAVNSQAQYFQAHTDTNKVLCLEYRRTIVTITPGGLTGSNWSIDVAPRHNGVLNVLFRDSSVQYMTPGEIDPTAPDIFANKWLPNSPGS